MRRRPIRREAPALPYFAAWGASLSALLAAAAVLPWPLLSIGLIFVNSIAVPTSMWMRSRGVDKTKASALAVLLAGLFLLPYLRSLPLLGLILSRPLSVPAYRALQFIVAAFSVFLAFRNFSLVTDFDLAATIVPATAILLLVAILSPGMHFAAFLLPAMLSFMVLLAHEHRRLLAHRAVEVRPKEKAGEERSTWGQARGPALIGAASVAIALVLAQFEVKLNIVSLIPADFQMKMADLISSLLVRAGRSPYGCIEPVLDLASNPAYLTDKVLFIVKADGPSYWRGTSFEVYTGRWWTHLPRRGLKVPAREGRATLPSIDEAVREGKFRLLRQRFEVVRPLMGGLFAAYEPWEVCVPGARRFIVKPDGTVNFSLVLKPGESYEVVSRVPVRSPEELRRASRKVPPEIAKVYLQLPPDLPGRVRELAERVAGGAPTWYDAALRVESFLERNYKGSLERQVAPFGEDFVDHFLFESKRGFCLHFASAMAVMLRCLGIPARVAAGFATGVYDKALKAYLVRESDAHAWVEVYFPGCGWVAFDPTPEDVVGGPRGLGARLRLALFSAGQALKGWWGGLKRRARRVPWKVALLAALAASALALLGWQLGRRGALSLPIVRGQRRAGDPAVDAYRLMLSILAKRGLGRLPHETPFEHLSRIAGDLGEGASPARKLAEIYVERVYGGIPADPSRPQEALAELRASLRRGRI